MSFSVLTMVDYCVKNKTLKVHRRLLSPLSDSSRRQSMVAVVSLSRPGVKRSAQWEPTAHNAPTSATVRTAPSATTSTGRVCATRVSRGRAARTASAQPASTDSAATSTALAGRRTRSGEAARFFSSLGRLGSAKLLPH